MASIVDALGLHLIANVEVATLLQHSSAPDGVRVFKGTIPQGMPFPAATLIAIASTPDYKLSGEIGDLQTIVQVDLYAPTEIEAEDIGDKIRLAISGYYGTMGESTVVKSVTIAADRELIQQPVDGSGRAGYRKSVDYRITYEREVTTY